MTNVGSSFLALCLSVAMEGAVAESLSATAFQYKTGKLGYLERNEVYAAWNPNDPATVLRPGMKVFFFGRAEDCAPRAANGPIAHQSSASFPLALRLTGIPLASDAKGQRWAPSADTEQCKLAVRRQVGYSFAHVNEDPEKGGIGLFTATGPDEMGRYSFFRQFERSGKYGTGINANIEGVFLAFRFRWQAEDAVRPWAGGDRSTSERKAEFRTVQSVVSASVPRIQKSKAAGEPVQVKQQIIPAFINRACFKNRTTPKQSCQFQYLLNIAIYRSGVTDWNTVKWFKSAGVFMDPGQGGIPVIHGPIARQGETVFDDSGLDLYTSLGDPSQHDLFTDKTFSVQVSFNQLTNALRLIVGKALHRPNSQITASDVASIFGSRWDDPDEWVLLSVNLGQEVHNPFEDVRAYIGGNIKEVAIGSVSFH